jgi:hypothetical protein
MPKTMTGRDIIAHELERADKMEARAGGATGWAKRNNDVFRANAVSPMPSGQARALVRGVYVLADYADGHYKQFGSLIGDDSVLGPAWAEVASGLRALLNGEIRPLDGGTMDAIICNLASANGLNPDVDL